ncbi:MAG: acyl-CoA-binding protein [Flavobacteriaceae bacterium]|jgi:acyl-CoA-binding protein|uniref:acyl-CoA-binding protein n=1 Tax=Candidatus Marifrigoribacter sp. Uisw_064 TaxID=3230970 RepID=UPI003ADB626F
MNSPELDIEFKNAVKSINDHTESFPADFLLRLYSYYKVATNNQDMPSSRSPLINAFKTNAIFQNKGLSEDEAKQHYIDAVTHYFLYRK